MLKSHSMNYYQTYSTMISRMQEYYGTDLRKAYPQRVYTPTLFNTPTTSSKIIQKTIKNIYDHAKSIQTNTAELRLGNKDSVLRDRITTSSNKDVLTASASKGASIQEHSFKITQLAKTQRNESETLGKDNLTSMNKGTNTFQLISNGSNKTLTVDISDADTNESALQKVASEIIRANMGVTASVVTNTKTGTIQLNVEGNKTGTNHSFSIVDSSGNAISSSKLDQTVQQAQNAKYMYNRSITKESQSNTVMIDEGKVEITFKNTTSNEEKISVTGNNKNIIEQTKALVNSYNELVDSFDKNDNLLNDSFKRSLGRELYSYELEQIGVKKLTNGKLSFNEDQLNTNLQNKNFSFERTIRSVSDFADQLNKTGSRIANMPVAALVDQRSLFGSFGSYSQPFSFMYSGIFYDRYF